VESEVVAEVVFAAQCLFAPAPEEPMQAVRGGGHLPAPAPEVQLQGVREGRKLPVPAPEEQIQGEQGPKSASTSIQGF